MKILSFFISRIFLNRWFLFTTILLLLLIFNALSLYTVRTNISTLQGYKEMSAIKNDDMYISNLNAEIPPDLQYSTLRKSREFYEYLLQNYRFAMKVEGLGAYLEESHTMPHVNINFYNEESYKLHDFELSDGKPLNYDYNFKKGNIPVLIGSGLKETYPIGSIIEIPDIILGQSLKLIVQGVLKENTYVSNLYAPNSKTYHNFSIFIPLNEDAIRNADQNIYVNGLNDLIIFTSDKNQLNVIKDKIFEKFNLDYNFFSQQENFKDFEKYYFDTLKIIVSIISIIFVLLLLLIIWNAVTVSRVMKKEFVINFTLGLSYSKLRMVLYTFFLLLFLFNLLIIIGFMVINSRYSWSLGMSFSIAFGFLGLTSLDWISIGIVVLIDVILSILIVEIMIMRFKKIPFSLGVLQ